MDELEENLLEVKDTSELMIDLAYSSLLYNNCDIAEEVLQMGKAVADLVGEVQERALNQVIRDQDVSKALAVIRLSHSLESIAEAARQIADVVLQEVEPHPVIQLSLRDADVIITSALVSEDSCLVGHTLGRIKLASHSGMWVIAIKRGRKYIYGPDKYTEIAAGDILFARGPEDGEEFFKDLASGKERVEEDTSIEAKK